MSKKILIVGRDDWGLRLEDVLKERGYTCTSVTSMVDAIQYLRDDNSGKVILLSEDFLPILGLIPNAPTYPQEFGSAKESQRGIALIQYARKEGLINSDTPAYLVSCSKENQQIEGITSVTSPGDADIINALNPGLHRADTRIRKKQ